MAAARRFDPLRDGDAEGLYEKVLPPLGDSLAVATSEFDTYDELRRRHH